MRKPTYSRGEHPYGERVLDWNTPPDGATGLIIDQWLTKSTTSRLFRGTQYFIFRNISGSYDYGSGVSARCGGFQAKMGYWWFDSEEKRDEYYQWLLSTGRFNVSRSD